MSHWKTVDILRQLRHWGMGYIEGSIAPVATCGSLNPSLRFVSLFFLEMQRLYTSWPHEWMGVCHAGDFQCL